MKALISIVGILVIIIGWILAGYVGIWIMLIGGLTQIVESSQMEPVNGVGMAVGLVKVLLCETGMIIGWIGTIIGVGLMAYGSE